MMESIFLYFQEFYKYKNNQKKKICRTSKNNAKTV